MRIAVGIPSYNEAKTIRQVALTVDRALGEFFSGADAVIVNMDSASTDGTADIFETTNLVSSKFCIRHAERGKGRNIRAFLNYIVSREIDMACLVDADVVSLEPRWIELLLAPVRDRGATFVTPVYRRDRFEALTTNTFARPIVDALYGVPIRQPIGGEFGLSGEFANWLLKQSWPAAAMGYGVDVFLTLHALFGGFRIMEAQVGSKMHKPSLHNRRTIFCEVAATAFVLMCQYDWRGFRFAGEFVPASEAARRAVSTEKSPPLPETLEFLEREAKAELLRSLQCASVALKDVAGMFLKRYEESGVMSGSEWAEAVLAADKFIRSTQCQQKDVENLLKTLFPLNVLRSVTLMRRMAKLAEPDVAVLFEEQVESLRELAGQHGRWPAIAGGL